MAVCDNVVCQLCVAAWCIMCNMQHPMNTLWTYNNHATSSPCADMAYSTASTLKKLARADLKRNGPFTSRVPIPARASINLNQNSPTQKTKTFLLLLLQQRKPMGSPAALALLLPAGLAWPVASSSSPTLLHTPLCTHTAFEATTTTTTTTPPVAAATPTLPIKPPWLVP